jgi:hypothetical protein
MKKDWPFLDRNKLPRFQMEAPQENYSFPQPRVCPS